jgi:hypothetical protein
MRLRAGGGGRVSFRAPRSYECFGVRLLPILELTYAARDLAPFARDVGYDALLLRRQVQTKDENGPTTQKGEMGSPGGVLLDRMPCRAAEKLGLVRAASRE